MADLSVDSTARDQAAAVRAREVSARELLELHLERIAERNPQLNAIVSLDEERAREGAAAADEALAAAGRGGAEVGPLHGLPFAFKDTHAVAGWRTTYGSPLYADHVPDRDELLVERVRGAGAVVLGKTNVPEFAAGSHTFNRVFGTTLNPVDPTRSAGGSSGGAACALASGMVPLADGSDMGGSLRNPASFCGVVGLRPSLGRVPEWPLYNQWETTSVGGPMARNVGDLALLLSVLAGPDPRAPQALGEPGSAFAPPVSGSLAGLRVALSVDLGGALRGRPRGRRGGRVVGVGPHRRRRVRGRRPPRPRAGRRHVPHPAGLALPGQVRPAARRAPRRRSRPRWRTTSGRASRSPAPTSPAAYAQRTRPGRDDARVLRRRHGPATTCWCCRSPRCRRSPPTRSSRPRSTGGRWTSYLDWMRSAYFITVTGCPAISVPCGRTSDGLPVGVQIVAPHGRDRFLLEVAAAFEEAVGEVSPG